MGVIDACTNIKDIRKHLEFVTNENKGEEEADMCYALKQIQKKAEKKGRRRGIQQMNELARRLAADGRLEELLQAAADERVCRQLLKEYGI